MINLFNTPTRKQEQPVADNNTKPKMMRAIEHLDAANTHMEQAMNVLSSIIMDWQKAADFLVSYRDSMIKTIEDSGGDVKMAVESQIRDYVQKRHNDGKDEEVEERSEDPVPVPPSRR